MAKSNKKRCEHGDLSNRVDALFDAMNVSQKQSGKIAKRQKKIIAAIGELEKEIKNLKICKCRKKKKKKSKKPVFTGVERCSESSKLQAVMDAPRNAVADDLKLISGVGPKLERTLNDLGIYHFDQIAAWTDKEVRWVDDYLMFTGRIERDAWIKQATALAKGGRDEYARVFGKEPR